MFMLLSPTFVAVSEFEARSLGLVLLLGLLSLSLYGQAATVVTLFLLIKT